MAARARYQDDPERFDQAQAKVERPRPAPAPASSSETEGAGTSPALRLQQALNSGLAEPQVKKWPPIATLGFILATCGGFWAAVAFAAAHILK